MATCQPRYRRGSPPSRSNRNNVDNTRERLVHCGNADVDADEVDVDEVDSMTVLMVSMGKDTAQKLIPATAPATILLDSDSDKGDADPTGPSCDCEVVEDRYALQRSKDRK